ncbi:MAG: transporter transrane protein [Firmicutes bacterium]|nr:transporter transrane protein [Bacillota bacterium]
MNMRHICDRKVCNERKEVEMSMEATVNKPAKYPVFRWFVLASAILMMFFSMMTGLAVAPLMGVIAKDLGVDIGTASFGIMGLNIFSGAVGVIIAGYLLDKLGIFKVMLGSMVLLIIANTSYLFLGHSFEGVVFIRVLIALGGSVGLIAINPVVSIWFPEKERGLALGLNALTMLGAICGFILGPSFAQMAGSWQMGMAWLSGILVLGLIFMLGVAANVGKYQVVTQSDASVASKSTGEDNFWKFIKGNQAFWLGLAVMALSNWANNAFNDLSPGYLAVDPPVGVGYGPEVAGQFSSGTWVGVLLGIFIGGIVIDKVFKGKSGILIIVGFICNLIFFNGILCQPIYGNPTILSFWLLAAGFVNPFTAVGNQYFAIKSFSPDVIGKVSATWTSISNFIGAFGVMLGSYALSSTGTYHVSFAIVAIVSVLGIIAAMLSKDRRSAIEAAYKQQSA